MPKAKVREYGRNTKQTRPIPRDAKDQTSDLEDAEQRVHARMGQLRYPGSKSGSFDPSSNSAYNGNTITAPGS